MAKKKPIKKNEISKMSKWKAKSTTWKADEYLTCSPAFLEASGVPGPIIGGLNMFLGHSDSGKTTALIESMIGAQKKGRLPVIMVTEGKWSFSHAIEMGFKAEESVNEETGEVEYAGEFIYLDGYDYIEQITDHINELFDDQEKGEFDDYNGLDIFWDSVGSIPCKLSFDGGGGAMHDARVYSDKVKQGIAKRVNATRKADNPYSRSLTFVNQPWVDIDMKSPMSQPEIKAKGGNALWLASTYVFLFGQQKSAKSSKKSVQKDKRTFTIAKRGKISISKNHDNGTGFEDGKVYITAHGFIDQTDAAFNKYKEEYKGYIRDRLGIAPDEDFEIMDTSTGDEDDLSIDDVANGLT